MQSVDSSARRARCQHRQELRTLTYVTLDAGNGGIVRNVNSRGVAVQAVAAPREKQRVRLRFELQFPRLRLDVFGEVSWANASGQCGIRFVDLPAQTRLQIDRWIFSNLLEAMTLAVLDPESAFAGGLAGIGTSRMRLLLTAGKKSSRTCWRRMGRWKVRAERHWSGDCRSGK